MKLSTLLPLIGCQRFEIDNERDFDYLSLCAENLDFPCCTFVDDSSYINKISKSSIMLMVSEELSAHLLKRHYGVCIINQPRIAFFKLHNYLSHIDGYRRKKEKSRIGSMCNISPMSSVADENVIIGNNAVIEEFVVIRENTIIGDHSIIRAGTVIGGQGFEFKHEGEKTIAVEHAGGVIIGDDVEIQHNTCVDRAIYPWDNTIIGNGVKIDNLVHIAHSVKLEKNTLIVANSSIGGRTYIGENSWVGISATVRNGIAIGKNSRINMGAVVTKDVSDRESVTGNFAISHDLFVRNLKQTLGK